MTEVPRLYTFKETQERLGFNGKPLSRTTMNRIISEQRIEFVIVGRRQYGFTEKAILDYLESRTVRVKQPDDATPKTETQNETA